MSNGGTSKSSAAAKAIKASTARAGSAAEAIKAGIIKAINQVPNERQQFKSLIIANPNFFGTSPQSGLKPKLKKSGDTTYEELLCVGLDPAFDRLEGVVLVKQSFGYSGDVCSAGSPEYVRFYLSFDGGATWQDQGVVSFSAYDVPGTKPLEYAVSINIDPAKKLCGTENIIKARAILSWNNPPTPATPDFVPVWGNVVDVDVQVAPGFLFPLKGLLEDANIKLPGELSNIKLESAVPVEPPKPLSVPELVKLYEATKVPTHRFLFPQLVAAQASPHAVALTVAGPLGTTVAPAPQAPSTFEIPKTLPFADLPSSIDINKILQAIAGILGKAKTDGDTSFEQLDCVGLNTTTDMLEAALTVKLSNGYSGNLCSAGSREFVAFWVDWGDGAGWTYAGTTSVNVHDISNMPSGGLHYALGLPLDVTSHRQACNLGAKTAKVRAILSWESAPPPGNPDYVPVWGNREETTVHITPGTGGVDGQHIPFLSSVATMPESQIDGNGLAHGLGIHGFNAVDSPFGGTLDISGHIAFPTSGLKYRVLRKLHSAPDVLANWVPITLNPDPLSLTLNTFNSIWPYWHQSTVSNLADADGYYPFEDYSWDHNIEGSIMDRWQTGAVEDGHQYDLRIDVSVDGNPNNDLRSNVVTVLIDNTAPVAKLDITGITSGVDCADFNTNATFQGSFTATDLHFSAYSFVIRPPGPAHGVLPSPASRSYSGMPGDTGDVSTYTLNTAGMDACGYSLTLGVWDRTNVNNGATNNYAEASVGFCLRTKGK